MKYFLKELLSSPLYLPSGRSIRWESVQGDQGLLATADNNLIEELQRGIRRRVGGVTEISEADYTEIKKNSANTSESDLSSLSAVEARLQIERLQARIKHLESPAALAVKPLPPPTQPPQTSAPLVVPDLEPVLMKPKRGGKKAS